LAMLGRDHEGFDEREIRRQLDRFFEPEQGMTEVIEDAEKQHDIETPEPPRREFVNIEGQVFDFGPENILRFEKGIERDAIDGNHLRATAFAFEAEPAVPCSNIEYTLTAQVGWDPKDIEAPTEVLDRLKPREHAAIGQVDGVIAKARMKLVGDLLHVLFKAAIARRDPFARFRHSTISVLSPGG